MKKFFLVAFVLLFIGCSTHNISVTKPDGTVIKVNVASVLKDKEFSDLAYDPNTGLFNVSGYKNNTSELVQDIFKAGYELGRAATPLNIKS